MSHWISVTAALPESGVKVMVHFRNELGKSRRTTAHYAVKHTIDASHWEEGGADETEDGAYEPEGWWEESVEGEELHSLNHHEVTHWMPLPEYPI